MRERWSALWWICAQLWDVNCWMHQHDVGRCVDVDVYVRVRVFERAM